MRPVLPVLPVFLLVACATPESIDETKPLPNPRDIAADRIIFPADEPADRALRLGAIAAMASELLADRVIQHHPDEAPAVFGTLLQLEAAIARVRGLEQDFWFETEMYDAARLLHGAAGRALERSVREVALSIVGGGFGFRQVMVAIDRSAKGHAMLADVQRLSADMVAGRLTREAAWQAIGNRINRNKNRVERLIQG